MFQDPNPKVSHIVGIDLAWRAERNPSAIAVGRLDGKSIEIIQVHKGVVGLNNIIRLIDEMGEFVGKIEGVAIDASLIINNVSGQRECETLITRSYGGRKAGCHSSNLTLYPDPDSVKLANALSERGHQHLSSPGQQSTDNKWMIECYPHPALIEIFELPERLLYKKGRVDQKRTGQVNLAQLLRELAYSTKMALSLAPSLHYLLDESTILKNKGRALKEHEDALDSIVCAYIGALYSLQPDEKVFGDSQNGYIYVPQGPSLNEKLSWLGKLVLFQSFFSHK
jgi:predicted RNase H-like nuclease